MEPGLKSPPIILDAIFSSIVSFIIRLRARCAGLFTPPCRGLVPWVGAVERHACQAGASHQATRAVLLGLLVAVVARLAQALHVGMVSEQPTITTVRRDVVHHAGLDRLPKLKMHAAKRVGA